MEPQHFALPSLRLGVVAPEPVQLAALPVPALPAVAVAGSVGSRLQEPVVSEQLLVFFLGGEEEETSLRTRRLNK